MKFMPRLRRPLETLLNEAPLRGAGFYFQATVDERVAF
jgi:hypothetical protein